MKINRLIKVCLLVATAGVVIYALGYALGGRVYGIELGQGGIAVNSNHSSGADGSVQYIEEEKELPAFSNLDIHMAFADVKVVASDHFGIKYHLNEKSQIVAEVDQDTLSIKQRSQIGNSTYTFFSIGFWPLNQVHSEQEYVIVYVPENMKYGALSIVNESGDIIMGDALCDKMSITNQFGCFQAKSIDAGTVNVDLESGDVTIKEVKTENLDIRSKFGKVSIDDALVKGTFTGEAESGDIAVGTVEAGKLNLRTQFGGIDGNHITADDLILDLDSGDCTIAELSSKTINVVSSFGGISLGMLESVDAYSVDVASEFGEISVNREDMGTKYKTDVAGDYHLSVKSEAGDVSLYDAN